MSYLDQVCYPPYGCFDKSSPYNFTFIPLPADPVIINTQFILYTQEREINLDICFGNDQSIPPDFHKDKKLVVITHGYLGMCMLILLHIYLLLSLGIVFDLRI